MKECVFEIVNEKVFKETLDNGIDVYLYNTNKTKNFYISISVKYGARITKYKIKNEVVDVIPVETYTVTEIQNENAPLSVNKVRMQYNGAIIDFDESLLERVLEVLRTW